MKYKAKLSGNIPDPINVMNTLKFEVSVEGESMELSIAEVWKMKNNIEKKEKSNVIFAGEYKKLPEEIMNGESGSY